MTIDNSQEQHIFMKNHSTKFLLLFLTCILSSVQSFAQPQDFNLTQIAHLPYTQHCNDIWGYVDGTGIEYALVGTQTGTSIVSLATPTAPVEILFIPGDGSVWRDLKTWNNFAYVTCDQGNDGLLIIDLSPLPTGTPTYSFWRPELTFNSSTDTLNKAHNLYIDEAGFCYISGSNVSNGETFILDVHTTPGTPVYIGATLPIYAHDAYARGDTLWTSDVNMGTFTAYDVTNRASPVPLANQATPRNFCHNAWISDDGQTLFTSDEKSNAWLAAYDVSDLSNIQELDRWRTPNVNTIPHNIHVIDDYLVTSYYTDGVIIIDGSRPDNLIEVARYDTYFAQPSTGFYGNWGAYPYSPSGLLLLSDIESGLFVMQPTYKRACWLEGIVTDQATSANLFGVDVQILTTTAEDKTDLSGVYKTGIGISGTYSVEYKKSGYIPQKVQVTLSNGTLTTQNIQLVPATPFNLSGQVVDSINQTIGVPNAIVQLTSSLYNYTTTTDAGGNFNINILPDNNYEVIAGKWGNHARKFSLVAMDSTSIPSLIYPIAKGYKDEFTLDLGWTQFSDTGTTSGFWERGTPDNLFTWQGSVLPDEGDIMGDIGEECLITGNNGQGVHGADDVDGGGTTMMSAPMDLSTAIDPILSYYYFFSKPWPANTIDSFEVYMTNGTDTATLFSTLNPIYEWSTKQEIRILDHITLSNNMRVYFSVNDDTPGDAIESLVDLFEISDSLATSVQVINNQKVDLHYYPNPFEHSIRINYNIENHNNSSIPMVVSNTLGQIIEERTIRQTKGNLELGQSWETGVYFITIGNQSIKVIKS